MSLKEEVKDTSKQLTITGNIVLLPLFCVGRSVAHISKKVDGWLLAIGRLFNKIMFK